MLGESANSASEINQPSYVIGPNVCITPQDLEQAGISLAAPFFQKYDFLVPAPWVADFYRARGFTGKISVWASGIQTDYFSPLSDHAVSPSVGTHSADAYAAKPILLYSKGRDEQDIRDITDFLKQHTLPYIHMAYGSYTEAELIDTARNARFGIIVDSSESQGLAIEELMSMNLPLVVYDISFLDQKRSAGGGTDTDTDIKTSAEVRAHTDINTVANTVANARETRYPATSIPYFDDTCGYASTDLAEVKACILRINEELQQSTHSFSPRAYILNQLSLKKQAQELCDILHYPTHSFSYTGPVRYWRNRTWHRPYLFAKYIVKYILWRKAQR
jgi:hypothetical protein